MARDDDETVRIRPRRGSRRLFLGCAVCAGLAAAGGAAFLFGHGPAAPPVPPPAPPPAPVPPAAPQPQAAVPAIRIVTAGESTILANHPSDIDVFRFASNPAVLVLDFASLHSQGEMLNRIAAMAEKIGAPHDRVLSDPALAKMIVASGSTPDTFYYGHDYGTLELSRFFAAADQAGLVLSAQEQWLRRLVMQQHGLDSATPVGLISIPAAAGDVTQDMRRTILHHELSHGEFFTNAAYDSWSHEFFNSRLDDFGRGVFRKFLVSEGYDSSLERLMVNETQAYLMFTPSADFFSARLLGVTDATLAEWRGIFRQGMPPGWLRETAMRDAGIL
jgi:hypothetical protein